MNVLGTKITVLNMLQHLWLRESVTIRQEEENVLETMCAWKIYSNAHPLGYKNYHQQQSLDGSCYLVKPKPSSASAESVGLLLACSPRAVRAGSWLLLPVCLCHLEHTRVCFLSALKWELSAWPSQTLLN